MIEFINVSKINKEKKNMVLENINLNIQKGEFVYFTGPNGAGKSTLLKMIYREKKPTSGFVLVRGKNVSKMSSFEVPYLRRKIGVVFQELKLLKTRSVFKNVSFPLEVTGVSDKEIKERVYAILNFIHLTEKADHLVSKLSTGEKQKVAIARAIINDPEILICDEVTRNLSQEIVSGIMKLLVELNKSGTTILFSTHDNWIVENYHGRVIRLEKGVITNDS